MFKDMHPGARQGKCHRPQGHLQWSTPPRASSRTATKTGCAPRTFTDRGHFRQAAKDLRYSRLVPIEEIADPRNDYNLNLPRYTDGSEPEESYCIIRPFTTL
jgi:hypothetical protein